MKWIKELEGTEWDGKGELWLDPEGNNADLYDCQLQINKNTLIYSWNYEGGNEIGSFTFNENGSVWVDSWHQSEPVECTNTLNTWGLFTVNSTYDVPSSPSWGWRSMLSLRPDNTLVLQMTNIAPWGEEGRAVRMIFAKTNKT